MYTITHTPFNAPPNLHPHTHTPYAIFRQLQRKRVQRVNECVSCCPREKRASGRALGVLVDVWVRVQLTGARASEIVV
jgi:hypothetical protein